MAGKDAAVKTEADAAKLEPVDNGKKSEDTSAKHESAENGVKKDEDVKDEVKDEGGETGDGDSNDKKRKSEGDGNKEKKKKKKDKGDGDEDAEGENMLEMLESEEIDLTTCPPTLTIEGSMKKSCNGQYKIMEKPYRGHPAYEQQKKDKTLYIYWHKAMWKISPEFGQGKSLMCCDGVMGLPVPLEPYPFLWKYYEKDELGLKKELTSFGMRVIDGRIAEAIEELPLQPFEPGALADGTGTGGTEASPKHKKNHHKKEKEIGSPTKQKSDAVSAAEAARREKEAKEQEEERALRASLTAEKLAGLKRRAREEKVDASVIEAVDEADDPKAALIDTIVAAVKKAKQGDAPAAVEDAAAASSASDSSESEAESESSEASSSSSSHDAKEVPAAGGKPLDAAAQLKAEMEKKAQKGNEFMEKLKLQLSKIKDPAEVKKKLHALKEHMKSSATKMEAEYGFSGEKMKELMQSLETQFLKPPAPPKGPPPKHLLKKEEQGSAAPSTPPQNPSAAGAAQKDDPDGLPHKTAQPSKSKLKAPWGGRRTQARITYVDTVGKAALSSEQPVESFKGLGEQLWYTQPGATVICDSCERTVPQNCGSLQGEPHRSQFAHSRFLCSDCIVQGHT